MWRGIIGFSGESGPGIFKAEPGRMGEVGEGASRLLGWERLNGPTTGCVPGEAVALASSPSLAGRGRRVAQGWGGPGAAGSPGRLEGCAPRLGQPPCTPSLLPLEDRPKCGCWRRVRARQGRSLRSSAWSSRLPAAPRALRYQGLVWCPARLFVSCEPRKPP